MMSGPEFDQFERIAAAQERQADALQRAADALEALAGLQMVAFDYDEETPSYTVEALHEEAVFHARGGERR